MPFASGFPCSAVKERPQGEPATRPDTRRYVVVDASRSWRRGLPRNVGSLTRAEAERFAAVLAELGESVAIQLAPVGERRHGARGPEYRGRR